MKKMFITSSIGSSKKCNGNRIPTVMDNTNGLLNLLKLNLNKQGVFVMICSDPNEVEFNDIKFHIIKECLNLSELNFKECILIDSRNRDEVKKILNKADLIYLDGGHPQTQMNFFNSINLPKLLQNTDAVIIGNSAGSMNLAKTVYCAPEEISQLNDERFYGGLGLTDINIEPHFIEDETFLNEEEKTLRSVLCNDSHSVEITCVPDGSFIFINDEEISYHGDIFIIKDGIKEKFNSEEKQNCKTK